jgi:hypothetical protein
VKRDRPDKGVTPDPRARKAPPGSKAPQALSDQAARLAQREIRVRLDRAARQVCLAALDPPARKGRKGLPEWLVRWAPPA